MKLHCRTSDVNTDLSTGSEVWLCLSFLRREKSVRCSGLLRAGLAEPSRTDREQD